jgi:hypothetical protein
LKKTTLAGSLIVLFLLALNMGASGQDLQTIITKGEGWFEGNDALIGKDRAIKDALVKAVEQAVGTMVSSDTQ